MSRSIANLLNASAYLLALTLLAACSEKPAITIAEIHFADADLPSSVAEISGFSSREAWGRWTDANIAPTAKIRFKHPLPKQFALVFIGQAMPNNEAAVIKIGNFQQQLDLQSLGGMATTIDVSLDQPEDTIEIIPPAPAVPKKLGLNDDPRKLGVGLATLKVEQ